MAKFLFQAVPIEGVRFKPIKIDIHKGVIKIVDKEIVQPASMSWSLSVAKRGNKKSNYGVSHLNRCVC